MTEHIPSALIQIERCILGTLLTGTDITAVSAFITPEMMVDADNRTFLQIIHDLDDEGTAITYITLAGRMATMKSGKEPMTYLSACMHLLKREKSFVLENYCQEIRLAYAARRFMEICASGTKAVQDKKPISSILRSHEVDVVEISNLQKKSSGEKPETGG